MQWVSLSGAMPGTRQIFTLFREGGHFIALTELYCQMRSPNVSSRSDVGHDTWLTGWLNIRSKDIIYMLKGSRPAHVVNRLIEPFAEMEPLEQRRPVYPIDRLREAHPEIDLKQ